MKKIGIITIHKSTSYGACLQAHALWKYLQLKGYECEIIDLYRNIHKGYIPSKKYTIFEKPFLGNTEKRTSLLSKIYHKITKRILDHIYHKDDNIKKTRFEEFNTLAHYSQPYKGIDLLYENPPKYDIYITGSDQVWNPTIGIPLEPYFLTFTESSNKIAYASSFGISNLNDKYKTMFKPWLAKYKAISCRETDGAQIIKDILNKNVPICLDPTLLIGAKYWNSISISPSYQKPYLLLFFLKGISKDILKYCSNIAKANNLQLIILGRASLPITLKHHIVANAGPKEFIGWIKNANAVITDSFHGLAFSIMLNNCFYIKLDNATIGKSRNSRMATILSELNLEDRILDISSSRNLMTPIDRKSLDNRLKEAQEFSAQYINSNL